MGSHDSAITYVCLWDRRDVLDACLLPSLALSPYDELLLLDHYDSWSAALSEAEDHAQNDLIVLCHQDTILLPHWRASLLAQVSALTARDPDWAVAGVAGYCIDYVNNDATHIALSMLGTWKDLATFSDTTTYLPRQAWMLDPAPVLIKRKQNPVVDASTPGFVVVQDLCLQAHEDRRGVWILPIMTEHHARVETSRLTRTNPAVSGWLDYLWNKYHQPYYFDSLIDVGPADSGFTDYLWQWGHCAHGCHTTVMAPPELPLGPCPYCEAPLTFDWAASTHVDFHALASEERARQLCLT